MFGMKFVGFPSLIMDLCYMNLTTTFKILVIGYRLIYWISEFSPKIPYQSGPINNNKVTILSQFEWVCLWQVDAGHNGGGKTTCTLCWRYEDVCRKHVRFRLSLHRRKMSVVTADMMPDLNLSFANREKVNKGIGIENVHYLNDGLWHMKTYKWRHQRMLQPPPAANLQTVWSSRSEAWAASRLFTPMDLTDV